MSNVLKTSKKLWSKFSIPVDPPGELDVVTLKIWYKRMESELWLSYFYQSGEAASEVPTPDQLEWSRWAIEKQNRKIRFTPVFPDRPVVIKPEKKMRLSRGGRTRIYVRVPIWIRIEVVNSSSINIIELPSVVLSNTWFGTVTEGELCYWISTGARQQFQEDHSRPFLAICPVELINNSTEDVNLEKLCLRVEGLSLFNHNGQLWGDETQVIYRGAKEINEIEFTGKAPKEARSAALISASRKPVRKGIRAKFFG